MPYNPGSYTKMLLTSIFSAATLRLGAMADLLWLFIIALTLDYITGIMAAAYNKQLCSQIGFRGVIRKVGKLLVIAVALLADEVVAQAAESFGATISTGGAIAAIVTIWLTLNELISILENLAKLNIAMPKFLLKAIKLLKSQVDDAGEELLPKTGNEQEPEPQPEESPPSEPPEPPQRGGLPQ